jgi:hypothetical protein
MDIILLAIVAVLAYRQYRTRALLFRMTEKVDRLLTSRGLPAINFFASPKMKKHLALHHLARRLESRIDRILNEEENTEEDTVAREHTHSAEQGR